MYLSRIRLRPEIGTTQLTNFLQDRSYGLHRLFWGLFSNGQDDQQQRDFLFREEIAVEQLPHRGKRRADPVYYVLSPKEPSENVLFEVETKPYRPKLAAGERLTFKLRVNAVITRNGKRHDIVMDAQNGWLSSQLIKLGLPSEGKKQARRQRLLDHAGDKQLEEWRVAIDAGVYRQKLEEHMGRTGLMEWAIKTAEAKRVHEWWQRQGRDRHGFEIAHHPEYDEPLLDHAAYRSHPIPEKGRSAGFFSLDLTGEVVVTDVTRFTRLLMEGTGPAKAFGCGLMLVRRA